VDGADHELRGAQGSSAIGAAIDFFAIRKMKPKWLKMSQISGACRRIGHEINCGVKLCAAH
jgi:hypothetical protein